MPISYSDLDSFNRVLSVWRPAGEKPIFILRWLVTEWCNYRCPYCPQSHGRFVFKDEYTAHAFDNHSLGKWVDAFSRHFNERRLSLVITGGEPMLDRKNMVPFINELSSMSTVECIRIDTNASWDPDPYGKVDPSKIILMCTYHPCQVSQRSFYSRVKQLLDYGFRIGMVNFVMSHGNFGIYRELRNEMAELGIPLHPNPLWDLEGQYSGEDLRMLKEELPDADYHYRSKQLSPYGKKCLFPALAYQMNQNGQISVGCHPQVSGSFFNHSLVPTFDGPVPCSAKACVCLDMYSFLEDVNRNTDVNPLHIYSDILKRKRGITSFFL